MDHRNGWASCKPKEPGRVFQLKIMVRLNEWLNCRSILNFPEFLCLPMKIYSSYVCQRTVSALHNAYNDIVDGGLKPVQILSWSEKTGTRICLRHEVRKTNVEVRGHSLKIENTQGFFTHYVSATTF